MRGLLGRVELALDEHEAAVPEARVREVDADEPAELLGRARAARLEQLEVVGHERLALLLVAAVDGEREQLAVGVGVDVARDADEVVDVGPPAAVVVGDLDGVAQQLLLGLRPQLADVVERELAVLAALVVDARLELIHGDLAEDGGDRALDRLGQQREPRLRGLGALEQAAEHERLAEHARGLGQRERGRHVEDALARAERRVHAVAELVRQRQHVAPARGPVEHHERVHVRRAVRAERPRALAGADRRVDPALVEEAADEVAELGREGRVGVLHQLARLTPADGRVLIRDGRHAVVVGEPVDPEQLRLQPVPAPRHLVAVAHGGDERLDGLVGRLVGEVAAREPVREAAQPVVDHLVGQQRVEDEAAGAQARRERVGHALGRVRAGLAVGQVQARERDLERDRLGAVLDLDLERGDLLLEQAAPGVARGQRLLGEDLLLGLGEQVRAVAARRLQVMATEVEALGGEQRLGALVVERGPLELEEQELRLDRRRVLLDPLVERAAGRVGGVGREVQAGEGPGARDDLLERPELGHGLDQARAVELGHVAGVALGERVGALLRLGQHRVDGGDGVAGVAVEQGIEVPGDLQDLGIGDVGATHGARG